MPKSHNHADVLIIGAGASGAVAGLRLAEAGLAVVTLEQGDWPDRDSFRGAYPDWELSMRGPWSPYPEERNNAADYLIDQSESDIRLMNWNGVGGATTLWGAVWPRFRPADFRARTEDGVGDDWPVDYAELAPYYARVERQFGVSGLPGDPNFPEDIDYPMPPLPLGEGGRRVARAHARLGWHWWPHPCAINSAPFDGRHACVQRGTCMSGCNEGAKASTDLTHWPRYVKSGGTLLTGARVSRITTDGRGLATGAEWFDRDGVPHHQSADLVLCACNGIGSARLLLLSACSSAPHGLANSSGLLGRGLMLHPTRRVLGYFDESIGSWQGPNGGAIICLEFVPTLKSRGFVRGAKWTLAPMGGPLGTALMADVWGENHHRHLGERFGHGMGWNLMAEDLAADHNRVTLAQTLVDSTGLPAPKVTYRVDDNSRRMLDFNEQQARRSLQEAGARIIEIQPGLANAHFMGTTRMGNDAARSVTDRWGMTHDIPNLGVIDGGVFVTSSSFNPTPTIAALALRTADHIIARRADFPLPDHRASVAMAARAAPASSAPKAEPAVTRAERDLLAKLADALIPAADGFPSASAVGVAGELLDKVLSKRPDLARPLKSALGRLSGHGNGGSIDPMAGVQALKAAEPQEYSALLTVVAGGYYLEPRIRFRIAYPGQEAKPFRPAEFEAFVNEGLLDHVLERSSARR